MLSGLGDPVMTQRISLKHSKNLLCSVCTNDASHALWSVNTSKRNSWQWTGIGPGISSGNLTCRTPWYPTGCIWGTWGNWPMSFQGCCLIHNSLVFRLGHFGLNGLTTIWLDNEAEKVTNGCTWPWKYWHQSTAGVCHSSSSVQHLCHCKRGCSACL